MTLLCNVQHSSQLQGYRPQHWKYNALSMIDSIPEVTKRAYESSSGPLLDFI